MAKRLIEVFTAGCYVWPSNMIIMSVSRYRVKAFLILLY